MKQNTCACCQGIHKSTPRQIANRPGLFALSYRAGTHATFIETMKARLSNFYLEDTEPGGQLLSAKVYPLSELATREAEDPAIALLDAWATVADVLTFYQERIANEGYLRTATERRSILELARLVGYTLRPGVAASTYLAYILEKESAVTIPAGSRAQSVPGPDETMQAFETSVDLAARDAWNTLRPRTTRPQSPNEHERVAGKALYFKGITTNLKPNDAILVDFRTAGRGQQLYRVMEVVPDAPFDRTKVTLQAWVQAPAQLLGDVLPEAPAGSFNAAAPGSPVSEETTGLRADVERVEAIVEHYSNKEEFGELLKTRTGGKVLESLELLVSGSPIFSDVELASLLNEQVLPTLKDDLRAAHEGRFTRLEPWIQQLIKELAGAIESVAISPSLAPDDETTDSVSSLSASTSSAGNQEPSATSGNAVSFQLNLEDLLQSLEKPPSIPPANPSQLERSIERAFGPDSDITPNLLTALRPGLAPLLLAAIEKRPVLEPTTAKVYAMRTRASVFGHNAPLQQVTNDAGKVIGHKEWTLARFGEAGTEDFLLEIRFLMQRGGQTGGSPPENATAPRLRFLFHTRIKIGGFEEVSHPLSAPGEALEPHEFEIRYDAAGESPIRVTVEVPGGGATTTQPPGFLPRCILTFKFKQRPITIKVDFSQEDFVRRAEHLVTTVGLDPTKSQVSITASDFPQGSEPAESGLRLSITGKAVSAQMQATEKANVISLDAPYPQITPGSSGAPQSWVAIERPDPPGKMPRVIISPILQVKEASRADYGLALKSTQLTLPLSQPWLNPVLDGQGRPTEEIDLAQNTFRDIRGTNVFAQSEELELSEAPLDPLAYALCGDEIELDGFYSGLEAGHWLIVTGERADIKLKASQLKEGEATKKAVAQEFKPAGDEHAAHGHESALLNLPEEKEKAPVIGGLKSTELVMLAGLRHNNSPGDKFTTTLLLANRLAYCYKLDTVTIYGNVAHATHGETRAEVLGSGDASQALQTFTLRQPPLTFVSAPTVSGTDTTLKVRVNDILWRETESLAELGAKDHCYLTRTNDEGKTLIIFGNGEKGARPATGIENITAIYRNGIGRAGNVRAEQISLLATKPLGVKEVINPIAATGGADKEDRDTARRNAPLAVMSLDRLVSVKDYEDFARTFAGIGKASAARLSDGRRQTVFLTIAGADDIPIAETSDLYQNLRLALHKFGDPFQAVQIRKRRLKLLIASANVSVHPDYLWEKIEPQVRLSLLDKFSFARRELGQDVLLSEIIGAMQSVEGVVYVDVDMFGAVDEDIASTDLTKLVASSAGNVKKGRITARMAQIDENETDHDKRIRPAELVIMTPAVADTLILKEVKA